MKKDMEEQFAEIHPQMEERAPVEVQGILNMVAVEKGARILDLGCGYGRHAITFAQLGYGVTGFEQSETLLAKARERAEESGVTLQFDSGDMRRLSYRDEFDLIVNMFTAFGLFAKDSDNLRVLKGVAKALKPSGKLVMDVLNREALLKTFNPRRWLVRKNVYYLEESLFDFFTGRLEVNRTIIGPNGATGKSTLSIRIYTLTELINMLRTCKLQLEAVYGDFHLGQYSADSPRMIVVAGAS